MTLSGTVYVVIEPKSEMPPDEVIEACRQVSATPPVLLALEFADREYSACLRKAKIDYVQRKRGRRQGSFLSERRKNAAAFGGNRLSAFVVIGFVSSCSLCRFIVNYARRASCGSCAPCVTAQTLR